VKGTKVWFKAKGSYWVLLAKEGWFGNFRGKTPRGEEVLPSRGKKRCRRLAKIGRIGEEKRGGANKKELEDSSRREGRMCSNNRERGKSYTGADLVSAIRVSPGKGGGRARRVKEKIAQILLFWR